MPWWGGYQPANKTTSRLTAGGGSRAYEWACPDGFRAWEWPRRPANYRAQITFIKREKPSVVSVVIPTRDANDTLGAQLEALASADLIAVTRDPRG